MNVQDLVLKNIKSCLHTEASLEYEICCYDLATVNHAFSRMLHMFAVHVCTVSNAK